MMPVGKAMEAVNKVTFPTLSRLQSEPDTLRNTFTRLLSLLSIYAFAVCWGLAAVAGEFMRKCAADAGAGAGNGNDLAGK